MFAPQLRSGTIVGVHDPQILAVIIVASIASIVSSEEDDSDEEEVAEEDEEEETCDRCGTSFVPFVRFALRRSRVSLSNKQTSPCEIYHSPTGQHASTAAPMRETRRSL